MKENEPEQRHPNDQHTSLHFGVDEEIEFKPGIFHFMLVNLTRDLNVGEEVSLTLHFANYLNMVITVPVKDAVDMGGSGMESMP